MLTQINEIELLWKGRDFNIKIHLWTKVYIAKFDLHPSLFVSFLRLL